MPGIEPGHYLGRTSYMNGPPRMVACTGICEMASIWGDECSVKPRSPAMLRETHNRPASDGGYGPCPVHCACGTCDRPAGGRHCPDSTRARTAAAAQPGRRALCCREVHARGGSSERGRPGLPALPLPARRPIRPRLRVLRWRGVRRNRQGREGAPPAALLRTERPAKRRWLRRGRRCTADPGGPVRHRPDAGHRRRTSRGPRRAARRAPPYLSMPTGSSRPLSAIWTSIPAGSAADSQLLHRSAPLALYRE
jgi:hypothetical protein